MDLKKIIYNAIEKNDSVKISNTLKVSASQQAEKVTVKLFRQGGLIWTDTNTLDTIVEDLGNEISNFG
jgi:hypothetical protein